MRCLLSGSADVAQLPPTLFYPMSTRAPPQPDLQACVSTCKLPPLPTHPPELQTQCVTAHSMPRVPKPLQLLAHPSPAFLPLIALVSLLVPQHANVNYLMCSSFWSLATTSTAPHPNTTTVSHSAFILQSCWTCPLPTHTRATDFVMFQVPWHVMPCLPSG